MPESRHKYLYERLGDHDFQQLIGALLTLRYTDYRPMPLRQSDGGRDGINKSTGAVYQVKWSVNGREKDPVPWLETVIKGELDNLKRLAKEGVKKYILVTNLSSTGQPGKGTFDKLDLRLAQYSKTVGMDIECLWREAIDVMVDSAPTETKWAYAEMLAGWDLIRYLITDQAAQTKDSEISTLVRKVAAVQWSEDGGIKFSQVDFNRERLTELFVDVPATLIHDPLRLTVQRQVGSNLGGAAEYIALKSKNPFILVRGAPGQGKSTLSQYLCQVFRNPFVSQGTSEYSIASKITAPRFPIRIDLSEYAAWIQGFDVFDYSDESKIAKGRRKSGAKGTIDIFLSELLTHLCGRAVTDKEIQELFDRVPTLVVLDGLDEVGNDADRKRVVKEINTFCIRGRSYVVPPKVVVTTRPNSAGLAEPDAKIFEIISLSSLGAELRNEFLGKWCAVHNIHGSEGRTLRRNFIEKTKEPYIGELASNPMQLTILLYLLQQQGDATPTQRTELYDAYMNLLLARESNKHPDSVKKYRAELMEIVPFLGWYFQAHAEEDNTSSRMSYSSIEAAMKHYQSTYGKPESVVDEIFGAISDRLWALTSKEEGSFEFEVLSLREYFAARYLYSFAGEGDKKFDRTDVFRELLRRPFWLNTVRFYGGNATGSDLYVLTAGIKQEITSTPSPHVFVASWNLVTDGVFNNRPLEAASIVDVLTSNLGIKNLLSAFLDKNIIALPESSHANIVWQRLISEIEADPKHNFNFFRIWLIREILGLKKQFAVWWAGRLQQALRTGSDVDWLELGAQTGVAEYEKIEVQGLSAIDGERAQLILNSGISPEPNSELERDLMKAIFDGQCSQTTSDCSFPGRVAIALSPEWFYAETPVDTDEIATLLASERRDRAIRLLRQSKSPFAEIASCRSYLKGEKGTTYPWYRTSTALIETVGRCWLASEIAVIGAASPLRNGFSLAPGTSAFGQNGSPATLISETRKNRSDGEWWDIGLASCKDDLSKAEWALALWGVAEGEVIESHMSVLEDILSNLPNKYQRAFMIAAERLGEHGYLSGRSLSMKLEDSILSDVAFIRNGIDSKKTELIRPRPTTEADTEKLRSLLSVAREQKWFKVDQKAVYR